MPNVESALYKLIQCLNLKITSETITKELERHPEYPSLLAVSDVLKEVGIMNSAFFISPDKLLHMPSPFIAHLSADGGQFIVVEKVIGDKIYTNGKAIQLEEFSRFFEGNVLIIDDVTSAGEKDYKRNRRKEIFKLWRLPISLLAALLLTLISIIFLSDYFNQLTWVIMIVGVTKTLGLSFSILLLLQSIDENNPLIKKLCETTNNRNCSAILSSQQAKVFNRLSWAEIGFFYFCGSWLCLLFGSASLPLLQFLSILNILTLPYTIYSVHHQLRVAKQWCVFCTAIQVLFWCEFFPLATTLKAPWITPTIKEVVTCITCFLFPIVFWVLIKPLLLASQQIKPLKEQLQKFKYNTSIFANLLTGSPQYTIPEKDWSLVLGNQDAANIITLVSNPYCNPCTTAHQLISDWLETSNDIQVRIVFATSRESSEKRRQIAEHFMSLAALGDQIKTECAINDWYNKKDFSSWQKIYAVGIDEAILPKLNKQFDWLATAGITSTPTILINDRELPRTYQISDLKYML